MTHWLLRRFVKDYQNINKPEVRTATGLVAGWVGIAGNSILAVSKIVVGAMAGSVAVIADGLNNLLDSLGSIISMIGFKLGAKEPDPEHPYGHGRSEYIAALAVAVLVLIVGLELAQAGIGRIRNPAPVAFTSVSFIVLIASVLLKIWLSHFNRQVSQHIDSTALKATAADSRNDAIATLAVLIAAVIVYFTGVNLDGWMSLAVAIFIIYSGITLIKEAIDLLLGQAPAPELVQYIQNRIMADENVFLTRDLLVHDYGPGRIYASAIVELDASMDALAAHEVVDGIQNRFRQEDNIDLIIHPVPVPRRE